MNWITINDAHYNLDHVQGFGWHDGHLALCVCNRPTDYIEDPDRRWYEHICNRVSLLPVELEEEK